jgi:hypothetical protein
VKIESESELLHEIAMEIVFNLIEYLIWKFLNLISNKSNLNLKVKQKGF